jgi:hypothetical protein
VLHLEEQEAVSVPLDGVARRQLDDTELVREAPNHDAERPEQGSRTARAVDDDRQIAAAQREGLQHPREAEDVIRVEVGQQDVLEIDEPRLRAQQLTLRSLTAVDEQAIAATPDERRRRASRRCRRGAGRAEKEQVEIHGRRS